MVTTSGTAAANLHPAVLEAAHAGVPLVALTADRPARLRGTGANQTTDQVRLFGDAASFADLTAPDPDALDAAWLPGGPVHLNCQFDEPLIPEPGSPERTDRSARRRVERSERVGTIRGRGRRTSSRSRCHRARGRSWSPGTTPGRRRGSSRRTRTGRCSPSRAAGRGPGANPIRTYRLLLGTDLGERIERVVVLGHPTLSRPVMRLLAREDVEVVSVRTQGRWPDRPSPVASEHDAVSAEPDDPAWLDEWRAGRP